MNAHLATPEYAEGYEAFKRERACPYEPGSTAKMLWMEGFGDAEDDEFRAWLEAKEKVCK